MSILTKNYEISVWADDYSYTSGQEHSQTFNERRIAIIGSDSMESQYKAVDPKFVRNINGNNTLTFTMYYSYIDNITGEKLHNPFVDYLLNESKIKLKYDDIWYDFAIKQIAKNSDKNSYTYTCSDINIQSLSKNGFNVELNTDLENNMGTAQQLGASILANTDWTLISNSFPQTLDESLVKITLPGPIKAYRIVDDQIDKGDGISIDTTETTISAQEIIYGFYSCHSDNTVRYQFLYAGAGQHFDEHSKDDDRIITVPNCQYYIDNVTYTASGSVQGYDIDTVLLPHATQSSQVVQGVVSEVSDEFRGRKYVFSYKMRYNAILKKYVTEYTYNNNDYEGYVDYEYIAPALIQNYISNNTNFTSTDGWLGTYSSGFGTNLARGTVSNLTYPDALAEIATGGSLTSTVVPYLQFTFPSTTSFIVNSSFSNFQRSGLKDFVQGNKYVLLIKFLGEIVTPPQFMVRVGKPAIDANGVYSFTSAEPFYLTFASNTSPQGTLVIDNKTYFYYLADVVNAEELTQEEIKSGTFKIQTFIGSSGTLNIEDFQIFPFKKDELNTPSGALVPKPLTPYTQDIEAKIVKHYHYYDPSENLTAENEDQYIWTYNNTNPNTNYVAKWIPYAEQIRSIVVKDSNYFNAIQTLCETFECWANIRINRNASGALTTDYHILNRFEKNWPPVENYHYQIYSNNTWSDFTGTSFNQNDTYRIVIPNGKSIQLLNYVGSVSNIGIKYGVNLNKVSRSHDSKAIVSKLIVKDAVNEFAPNGVCSISAAGLNLVKDNALYDFSYYINQKLINASSLNEIQNKIGTIASPIGRGLDLQDSGLYNPIYTIPIAEKNYWNCYGFNSRLARLNSKLQSIADQLEEQYAGNNKLETELKICQQTVVATTSSIETDASSFYQQAGFNYNEITVSDATETQRRKTLIGLNGSIGKNISLANLYVALCNSQVTLQKNTARVAELEPLVEEYKEKVAELESERSNYIEYKKQLQSCFNKLYFRFIQEGTWINQDYTDNNQYYLDALSTLYNSSMPQTTYTVNAYELSQVKGYELIHLKLGDRTWVEDIEFFGYAEDGITPYREEVVITEISYNLDNPEKNTIKVQNFKNQFADLFKSITATVQSVQYSSGSYDKAAALAAADTAAKMTYLHDALNSSALILSGLGAQTVVCDEAGITVTDANVPDRQLRIVSNAILIKDSDPVTGTTGWRTAIDANGICADTITTGTINTNTIQLMGGNDCQFLWNYTGITAFDWDTAPTPAYVNGINYNKWVRFNKWGIFGVDGKDGRSYNPEAQGDINILDPNYTSSNQSSAQLAAMANTTSSTFGLTHERFWFNTNRSRSSGDNYTIKTRMDSNGFNMYKIYDVGAGTNRKIFGVDNDGNGYFDGFLTANVGGQLANWVLKTNYFYNGTILDTNPETPSVLPTTVLYSGSQANFKVGTGSLAIDGRIGRILLGNYGYLDPTGSVNIPLWSDWYNFIVDNSGHIYAQNATIKGHIEAESGLIGGWLIQDNSLVSTHFILAPTYLQYGDGTRFKVTSDGYLNCSGATVSGTIYASGGQIGGWNISNGNLSSNYFTLSPNYLQYGDGTNFKVTTDGYLNCNQAKISGKITATDLTANGSGTIGGWSISQYTLKASPPDGLYDCILSADPETYQEEESGSFLSKCGLFFGTRPSTTGDYSAYPFRISASGFMYSPGWSVQKNQTTYWTCYENMLVGLKSTSVFRCGNWVINYGGSRGTGGISYEGNQASEAYIDFDQGTILNRNGLSILNNVSLNSTTLSIANQMFLNSNALAVGDLTGSGTHGFRLTHNDTEYQDCLILHYQGHTVKISAIGIHYDIYFKTWLQILG